jgi:hypothetical protein
MIKTSTKLIVMLVASMGLLTMGNVFADEHNNCPNHNAGRMHTINLKVGGPASNNRRYPALQDSNQNELHVCHGDTLRFLFPGRDDVTIAIRSGEKINQDVAGDPPYRYGRGRAGILINPDPGVPGRSIKYDVIVESSDNEFEDLDPVIIIDTVGPM